MQVSDRCAWPDYGRGLAAKYSFHAAIALLASVYFLDIFATLFLIPELRGKPLD
jgi:hypothetical protein